MINIKNLKIELPLGTKKKQSVKVSGISSKLRQEIWSNKDDFLGRIISVKAESITKNKISGTTSLSFPRFVEIRYDKTEADTLEMVIKSLDKPE